jgi:hypothetical protein
MSQETATKEDKAPTQKSNPEQLFIDQVAELLIRQVEDSE